MESVPIDFCERVSALWKCCGRVRCYRRHLLPTFVTAKWSFTKPINVHCHLLAVDGRWKYGFTNPDYDDERHAPESRILTAGELAKRSDMKRIRVVRVEIYEWISHHFLNSLDVDLDKLPKFTSCLMDEPEMARTTYGLEVFENTAPDGAVIRKWLNLPGGCYDFYCE